MFLSFSALLTVNAFAPQMFWDHNKIQGRFPSSLEEDRLEQLELDKKEQEKKEELKNNEASIQCLKDDKSSKLDEEIKKLMADKEAILKELEELKKERKETKKEEKEALAPEKEEKKTKVAKADNKEDVLSIMSQLTSLMISQQQQQMMMMQQMFSMMAVKQPSYQSPYDMYSGNEYISPYAYIHDSFSTARFHRPSFLGSGRDFSEIGIGYSSPYMGQDLASRHVEMGRAPSNQMERYYFQPQFQQQQQQQIPHNGFDFGASTSSMDNFQRLRFE